MAKHWFRVAALALLFSATVAGAEKSHYWEWGWGTYGSRAPIDMARYDWSLINFGNIGANQETLDFCNEILRLNPKHKFLIRVWPIMGKGDSPENRFQATLFHYLYQPGVRDEVLAEIRSQIRLVIDGVKSPANVVGSCFLEELPGPFAGVPFGPWKAGDPLPWDMKRFEKEISAELGAPLDWGKVKHRLWWGKKYAQVIGEINQTMKEASAGRLVIYYQATAWSMLDHLAPGQSALTPGVVPISYQDILKPGLCDGIFGYPNNERVWTEQTEAIVNKYHCLLFSQTSTPPGMRLSKFDDMVKLARWENPGNLGSFLYFSGTRGTKAWNELPWLDGTRYWTIADLARKVGWEYKIGLDVVDRYLQPQVALDYNAAGQRQGGFMHVYGQVVNPRDASWYGGDAERAVLKNVSLTLSVPAGFSIPLTNSALPAIPLGDIPAQGCKAGDWWVRVEGDGTLPAGQAFKLTAQAGPLRTVEVSSAQLTATIPSLVTHEISRSGDTWIEPAYRLPEFVPAVELVPRLEVVFPELRTGDQAVLYRDVLTADSRLVIGPGLKATLFAKPLLSDEVRTFAKQAGPDGLAVFREGYSVCATPAMRVRPSTKYRFQLAGKAGDGAIVHAIVFFAGKKDGKPVTQDVSCFYGQFTDQVRTLEATVEAPAADPNTLTAIIRIYRHKSVGTLYLKALDFAPADASAAGGLDVTAKLEGVLPPLSEPFTQWTYRDRSDPDPYDSPKLTVRFFKP